LLTQLGAAEVPLTLEVQTSLKVADVETNTSYVVGTELVALLQLRVTVIGRFVAPFDGAESFGTPNTSANALKANAERTKKAPHHRYRLCLCISPLLLVTTL
jgi:hypothetical protein